MGNDLIWINRNRILGRFSAYETQVNFGPFDWDEEAREAISMVLFTILIGIWIWNGSSYMPADAMHQNWFRRTWELHLGSMFFPNSIRAEEQHLHDSHFWNGAGE
mmetsp:Transcript_6510/g.14733  ORF Transcript_6510/g.14733 Transcript_6510/m.14733 type:complete len:105 (+) Transcript_6510:39-353(+)